jgi:hypothetical protein
MDTKIHPAEGPSTISSNQIESASPVMIDMPVSNLNGNLSSAGGASSPPKKKSQSDSSTVATPLDCPDTSNISFESVAECTEHSSSISPFFRSAINLMRAFDSAHPLATETTSAIDAEIMALSFLFDCDYGEAKRWYPFFRNTLERAQAKRAKLKA